MESAKEPVAPPSVEEEPEPQTVDASPPSPLPPQQPSSPPSVPTSSAATSMGLPDQTAGDLIPDPIFLVTVDCYNLLLLIYNRVMLGPGLFGDQQILFHCL